MQPPNKSPAHSDNIIGSLITASTPTYHIYLHANLKNNLNIRFSRVDQIASIVSNQISDHVQKELLVLFTSLGSPGVPSFLPPLAAVVVSEKATATGTVK